MKLETSINRKSSFQFVLDELSMIRPAIKQMFGFTYVYLDEKLLLSLRDSAKQPQYNGVWIYTQAEHLDSRRTMEKTRHDVEKFAEAMKKLAGEEEV